MEEAPVVYFHLLLDLANVGSLAGLVGGVSLLGGRRGSRSRGLGALGGLGLLLLG